MEKSSLYPESKVTTVTTIHDTPSGDCDTVSFELWGQKFMAISAGPFFQFNPSLSFFVNFDPSRDKDAAKSGIDCPRAELPLCHTTKVPGQEISGQGSTCSLPVIQVTVAKPYARQVYRTSLGIHHG